LAAGNNVVTRPVRSLVRFTATAGAAIINAIEPLNGRHEDGDVFFFVNDTGYGLTFTNESGFTSSATNRIRVAGSADGITVPINALGVASYDGNLSRWVVGSLSATDVTLTDQTLWGNAYVQSNLYATGSVTSASVVTTNVTAQTGTFSNVVAQSVAMPTNTASFTIATNDFVLNRYYTNAAQRAWVGCSVSMTNEAFGDVTKVALYLDQDADGTWERTGVLVELFGATGNIPAGTMQLGAWVQPGGRFLFTNFTAGSATSWIQANSSQWVRQ
jgi:hypothetical protein